MGYDNKPNLTDSQFEQCPGNTLHLSGCTIIAGQLEINSAGSFIAPTNAGVGKVWTSDVSGVGTWQTISGGSGGGITSASNGLTAVGSNVVLGGLLTANTNIQIPPTTTFRLSGKTDSVIRLNINRSSTNFHTNSQFMLFCENAQITVADDLTRTMFGSLTICPTNSSIWSQINTGEGIDQRNGNVSVCAENVCIGVEAGADGLKNTVIHQTSTGITICSGYPAFGGIKYNTDYSTNFTDRSLVDCGYVDRIFAPKINPIFSGLVTVNGQIAITGVTQGTGNVSALVWDSGTTLVKKLPAIDEWVNSESELLYTGQKLAWDSQIIMQTDVGICNIIPNYKLIQNINLKNIGNNMSIVVPQNKRLLINSAKLIFLNDADPTSFNISMGNNACGTDENLGFNNLVSAVQIDDVLMNETYELIPQQKAVVWSDGNVYFRVRSGSTNGNELCAHLLIQSFVF